MDIIRPTDAELIGRVTLADEIDTRLAIAAAKRALRRTADQQLKSEQRFCAAFMRPPLRELMI